MAEQLLKVGQKMEVTEILLHDNEDKKPKTYPSQILDIHEEEDKLDIAMPIVGGRIIPLPVGGHFSACFYTPKGLYQCNVVITERYKTNNIYVLVVQMKSALKKFQRRQYYRLETVIPITYVTITEAELRPIQVLGKVTELDKIPPERIKKGNTLDISGGGMKFASDERFEKGQNLIVEFSLPINRLLKTIRITAKVIDSMSVQNRFNLFHHRIEFGLISPEDRENMIKCIFEEERKKRNKERM